MDEMALNLGVAGAWVVLRLIGDWLIFRKAGKPGWHSIIPVLHMYDEYDICWKGSRGFLAAVCLFITYLVSEPAAESAEMLLIAGIAALVYLILEFKESRRLAWSFGRSSLFGLFLFIFGGLGRIILGLGRSEYKGKGRQ